MLPAQRAHRSGLTVPPPGMQPVQHPLDPGFSAAVPAHVIAAIAAAVRPHQIDPGFGGTAMPAHATPAHQMPQPNVPIHLPMQPAPTATAPIFHPAAAHQQLPVDEARPGYDAGHLNLGAPPADQLALALLQHQMLQARQRALQQQYAASYGA